MPSGVYIRNARGPYRLKPVLMVVGPSIAYVQLSRGQFALIDSDDAGFIGRWNWNAKWSKNSGSYYARRTAMRSDPSMPKQISMHVAIMGISDQTIDHKNSYATLDNRRCNLRHASRSDQSKNRGIYSNNTSGMKGVSFHKETGKYQSQIQANGKKIYLGIFPSMAEAYQAFCEAAVKYHGEFARME